MPAPPNQVYRRNPDSLWAFSHLRDAGACECLHGQRTHWRGFSHPAAFGPDRVIPILCPGAVLEATP